MGEEGNNGGILGKEILYIAVTDCVESSFLSYEGSGDHSDYEGEVEGTD